MLSNIIEGKSREQENLEIEMESKMKIFLSVFLITVIGCVSTPRSVRSIFWEQSQNLNPPQTGLVLETLKVLVLLEKYCWAFNVGDEAGYISCFSPQFSYYENTISWHRREIRENYFERYSTRELKFEKVEITFYKKTESFWLKQADYDWLQGKQGDQVLGGMYTTKITDADGEIELSLGEVASVVSRAQPSPHHSSVPVTVFCRIDPAIEFPMAEVRLKTNLRAGAESTVFSQKLVQIFLLENHGGRWRIVSLL